MWGGVGTTPFTPKSTAGSSSNQAVSVSSQPFIDAVTLRVEGGRGGKGCESFERLYRNRSRRPSGGNGGDGGDVYLQVSPHCNTLLDFYYRHQFQAAKGSGGGSNRKKGRKGKELILPVPPGTVVFDTESNLRLRDLRRLGERVIVARGGLGGRGNVGGKIPTEGETGEVRMLRLELQLIADCGLVGFPNAGKSTLLSVFSKAHPKIAPYPFTTKHPQLGVVEDRERGERLVCVEIPGLIEGAHEGKGLGHVFLRHLKRTSTILHLIDMSGESGRDPFDDYRILNRELKQYDPALSEKPQLLVANKMDVAGAREKLLRFQRRVRRKVLPVSAATGEGIPALLRELFRLIRSQLSSPEKVA